MKKLKLLVMAPLFCAWLVNAYAVGLVKNEHYVVHYEGGNSYDVQLTDTTITWLGLEGTDQGRGETDAITRKKLNSSVDVIQWSEKNGSFATLILDFQHMVTISSARDQNGDWLAYGTFDEVS